MFIERIGTFMWSVESKGCVCCAEVYRNSLLVVVTILVM